MHDWRLRVADAIGNLMKFWGFKRNMGRIWALLYLDPEPMTAVKIADELSLSSGAVSMTINELVEWSAIQKSWRPGDRKDYYTAETRIWKMVSRVLRERELRHIDTIIEVCEQTLAILDQAETEHNVFVRDRIANLLQLAKLGKTLLTAVLSGQSVDASPLRIFKA